MRRKRLAALKRPRPVHRRTMSAPRQRFTLRVTRRIEPTRFSMLLVVASERRSVSGSSSFTTVSVSSRPSRRLAAASSWPLLSSQEASARSFLRAASAVVARYASRIDVSTQPWRPSGRCSRRFRCLWTWQRWITARSPKTSSSAFRIPFPPSMMHRTLSSIRRPRLRRPWSRLVHRAAFSVEPWARPSGTLVPSALIPSATTTVCRATSIPSTSRNHQIKIVEPPLQRRAQSLTRLRHQRPARRALAATTSSDALRPGLQARLVAPCRHPQQDLVHHPLRQRIPIPEALDRRQARFAPFLAAYSRPIHADTSSPKRQLRAGPSPVVVRPIRLVLPLRASQARRVVLHQLVQGSETEVVDPVQQALLRRGNPCDQRHQPLAHLLDQRQPDLLFSPLLCSALHGGSLSPAL